jgi:hypothetical protein
MKCHEFQSAIGADPNATNPDLREHLDTCTACAAYLKQMQDMDRLIYRALAIPVDVSAGSTARSSAAASKRRTVARWQIAASLVASIMIAASIWVASTHESLAEQIVTHADDESFAIIRTEERADPKIVAEILAKSGLNLRANAAEVSYAQSCLFRGHRVPHLVVQTDQGPVTVLVLANEESTKTMQRFEEDGYEGMIVPAPRGVLAVLGKDVPVEQAAERLLWAIEYW